MREIQLKKANKRFFERKMILNGLLCFLNRLFQLKWERLFACCGFVTLGFCSTALSVENAKYLYSPEVPHFAWSKTQESDYNVFVDLNCQDSKADCFHSVEEAVRAVQEHQKKNPDDSITIIFKSNVYYLNEPIILDHLKGTADNPIVLVSDIDNNVQFNGGTPLLSGEESLWNKIDASPFFQQDENRTKSDRLNLCLKSEIRDKIWVASLSEEEFGDLGDATELGKRSNFFWLQNGIGIPQTLARFPNEGFLNAGQVLGKTKIDSWNGPGCREGLFEYLEDNPSQWLNESDARLFGYWFWDWAEGYAKIDSIDCDQKTIKIAQPYHNYGYKNGFRYYGVNLLSELDSPGEYYLDRDNRLLFWYPEIETPNSTATVLSTFRDPYMLELRHCSHLIVSGFQFQYGRQNAIKIDSCDHCLIDRCFIYGFGKDALHFYGGSENGLLNSRLECFGGGGITIEGGDRKTLTPCNHFVENNRIESFSLIQRTYAPAILARGCGIRIAHNEISGSSSSAMRLEGNDMLVEFNKIRNVVEESDDQGGIDSWYDPSFRGIVIRYNYWGNIIGGTHCGAAGIRLDDMISGFKIYGNIFERCGAVLFGAVQIHGGKANIVENNLFLDCFAAVSFSRWGDRYLKALEGSPEALDKSTVLTKIYENVDIRSPLWQAKYPELKEIHQDPDVNFIRNNLIVNGEHLFLRDGDIQQTSNNVEMTLESPTVLSILNDDILEKNGLQPIPFDQFGNQLPFLNRSGILRESGPDSVDDLNFKPKSEDRKYWMFIGTYSWNPNDFMKSQGIAKSQGIYAILFDPDSGTFEGTPKLVARMSSPSYLETFRSKSGKMILYAVEEGNVQENSANVYAFQINEQTGDLTFLNSKATGGDWPCHLSVVCSGNRGFLSANSFQPLLAVANYGGGDFVFYRLNDDGSLGEETDRVHYEPDQDRKQEKGVNLKRQESPKAHCAAGYLLRNRIDSFDQNSEDYKIFLCDLGCDKVYVGSIDHETLKFVENRPFPSLNLEAGAGPRHIDQPNDGLPLVFVNNELNSTITPFLLRDSSPIRLASQSTLPQKYQGKITDDPALVDGDQYLLANTTAEIECCSDWRFPLNRSFCSQFPKLSELLKQPYIPKRKGFVYVSNRGNDSIAVFQYKWEDQNSSINPSQFNDQKADDRFEYELKQIQPTFGKTPRFFAIDPSGEYLIVCNQDSGSIILFKINYQTGELIKASTQGPICVPFPVSLAFVRKIRLNEL